MDNISAQEMGKSPKCVAPGCMSSGTHNWKKPVTIRVCNLHWQRLNKYGSFYLPIKVKIPPPICSVEGCEKLCRSKSAKYCEKHYYRKRRGNDPACDPTYAYRSKSAAGYMILRSSTHPLATTNKSVGEHRAVVYAHFNGKCPNCYWCGRALTWKTAVVDHLNEKKSDNRLENLAVSCNRCNLARGAMIPFIRCILPNRISDLIATFTHMRR